jgi:hypothetical protein
MAAPMPSESDAWRNVFSAWRTLSHLVEPSAVASDIDRDESTMKNTSSGARVAFAEVEGHVSGTGKPVRAPHAATVVVAAMVATAMTERVRPSLIAVA